MRLVNEEETPRFYSEVLKKPVVGRYTIVVENTLSGVSEVVHVDEDRVDETRVMTLLIGFCPSLRHV